MSFSAIPNYRQSMHSKGTIERTWYQFFSDVWKGKPSGGINPITPASSPYTYQAAHKGFLIIQGGTVSLVQFSRDGLTNYNTGQTSGTFPLAQGDSLIVIYTAMPTITWVPL